MMSEHADFLNGLHVVAYELQRVIGELDEMQDRLGISGLDRVSLDPLQWALDKLADDLHDASAEICNARQYEASAKREADTARQQLDEHVQWASFYNGLRAELETVKAERDSLQRQWDDLEKSFVQSMQPKMASVVQLVEAAKATAVEVTKKLGELPDEPAPEPYPWQVGDEIECPGVTRRKVVGTCRPWVSLEGIQEACPQPEWERRGWKLHRKASDIQPQAPEPYPWQVGDEINPGNGDRILVVQHVQDGLVKFCGEACTNTQADLEKFGCTIHRKATETAPESYDWQVGDEIEDDGGVRRPVTDRDAKGWVSIKGNGALPQFEWELRRWKLYRKAADLPDIPPLTPQQVADFAAVTEPFDDSVSAAAADEGRP
jgi:hypothetical protein